MVYLLTAILCSTSITLIMRFAGGKVKSDAAMYFGNYVVCTVLSALFMGRISLVSGQYEPAIWIGLISGFFYLTNLILQNKNIQYNGVALASMFGKLGVAVSTMIAVIFFRERLSLLQACGFILALSAIVLMNLEKGTVKSRYGILLLIFLVSSGLTDSMANFYDKIGTAEYKDLFLLVNFAAAMVFCLCLMLYERKPCRGTDFLWGALFGVPNYLSSRFILWALGTMPASLVFPVYSVSCMLILVLCGRFLFKEPLDQRKKIAIGIILVSLVLLNI